MTSPDDIRKQLKKLAGLNLDEMYHVTSFRCYRRTRNNETQTVIVEIHDGGPEAPADLRYSCHAITKDGHFAAGNPADTIDHAIQIVAWGDLDKEPDQNGSRYWRAWPADPPGERGGGPRLLSFVQTNSDS